MHRIFLSREQAETLVLFCKQRGLRDFRVANDDGVYVGQTYREEKCIYFFPRCNPAENPHWRDIVRDWLWNIAICDLLEIRMLEEVLSEDATYASISIRIELLGTVVEGFSTLPQPRRRYPSLSSPSYERQPPPAFVMPSRRAYRYI